MKIKEIKQKIIDSLRQAIGSLPSAFVFNLEAPLQPKRGELAFSCFQLAKYFKKSPEKIASELTLKLQKSKIDFLDKIENVGPYINFFVNKKTFFSVVCEEILKKGDKFGQSSFGCGQKIGIEYSAPNANKPQHLGHLRNNLLGDSLANLLKVAGFKVRTFNLINDRGVHICKSMLAYRKWGKGRTPDSEKIKGDHFVGNYYVLFEEKAKTNPRLLREAQEMLNKWEAGDLETLTLWRKMNKWAIDGLLGTYQKIGIKFDELNFESDVYNLGKDIILKALKKGLCYKRKDGAVEIDLRKYDLGKKVLLRPDGTSVYITQDIGLAKLYSAFKFNKFIYVVASEQNHHFHVLFKILELFGIGEAGNYYHFSYGLVFLPKGKMKSRQGEVVEVDGIIKRMEQLAKSEILKRDPNLTPVKVSERAQIIAQAALKFFFLKFKPSQTVNFDPLASISFEGDTGPYLQYTYARIQSILKKDLEGGRDARVSAEIDYSLLGSIEEIKLIKSLFVFQDAIQQSFREYNPSVLAHYLLRLARRFNEFYHQSHVLKSKIKLRKARLALLMSVAQVLKTGLNLLGIDVLEEM
ncbi:arginine--tRNA ligase [Candidatus Parcubacteria bacterium 4484_255]|nr:MAG: arginine--tRNA ligase [Candidatus Parcubacteria bacterium 4484_255]